MGKALAFLAYGCSLLATVSLHGCGDVGTTTAQHKETTKAPTTKAPTTTFSATTVATTAALPDTPEGKVTQHMQDEYNLKGELTIGNVIWFPEEANDTFEANLHCSKKSTYECPEHATADCAMSAAVYNKEMILEDKKFMPLDDKKVGVVFNTSVIANQLSRCSYLWQKQSPGRVNRGCGRGAAEAKCTSKYSAYQNVCKSTDKTCTADSEEVKTEICHKFGGPANRPLPRKVTGDKPDIPCVIPGPAMNFAALVDATIEGNNGNLEKMVDARRTLSTPALTKIRNEVVIDGEKLWDNLAAEGTAIIAIIAAINVASPDIFDRQAVKFRKNLCETFPEIKKCPPLIQFDETVDTTKQRLYTPKPKKFDIVA